MQTENQQSDCEPEQSSEQLFDIQAVGLDTEQRHGELAEAKFLAKASSLGFGVAKPWGDERYDFVLDSGYSFWRVQVKSTRNRRKSGEYGIRVAGGRLAPYDETEIDFLVAYLVPEDIWYVIPVKMLRGWQALYFSPQGRRKAKWAKHREGWCQMACPYDENGPSKIVTPRCRRPRAGADGDLSAEGVAVR